MNLFLLIFLVTLALLFYSKSTFGSKISQKVYVVSFAHDCCKEAQKNLEKTAKFYGADAVYSLNLDTLKAPIYLKEYLYTTKRGAGYWIWKSYAIKQIMEISNPDDIIIYVDSSTYFNKSMKNIINFINKNDILCFKHSGNEAQSKWTKMNAVKYFGYNSNWCETGGKEVQIMGAFVGVKNNNLGNLIVEKWINTMKNTDLVDDSPSNDNCNDFVESRHDQQILSLILYKTGIIFPVYNKELYGWVWHEPINGKNRHL